MGVCKYWGPWVKWVRDEVSVSGPWVKGVWGWVYESV